MHKPPQLKGFPITGHYKQFKKDPIGLLLRASDELGDLFILKVFNKSIYFVNHPDLIEHVTQTNYTNYVKTPATPLRRILGEGIITSDGDEWLKRRRLYQPALNNTSIKSYFDSVQESVDDMMEKIEHETHQADLVNITKLMTYVTVSVLGKTLFSSSIELESNISGDIATIMEWISERRLRHPFVVPTSWPTKNNRKFIDAVNNMDSLIYKIIEEKKQENHNPDDLLSRLMKPSEDDEVKMNAKELRDEVMTIFLAGHETSANVLNWTFHMLASHQHIQAKVYEEIAILDAKRLCYEDLHHLKYTSQVLNETMRLYPPVWTFGRVNKRDDEIGGYHIPAGSAVRISPLTIHRRSEYWANPEVFDPNRFNEANIIQQYTHIPFGAGPRLCAGRNFAMMEMLIILVEALKKYKISPSDQVVEMAPMITLRSKEDILLRFEKR